MTKNNPSNIDYYSNVIGAQYVFSLSTSPRRISKIKPVIDSLFKQTIPPHKVYINLPYVFKRDNSTFEKLPDFITQNPNIFVNWCEDIGPSTKIIPTAKLLSKTNPNMYIISVDDDSVYLPILAEKLIKTSKKYPNTIITGSSFIIDNSRQHLLIVADAFNQTFFAQLLEGFAGVLYTAKMFDDFDTNTLNINNIPRYCYLADDLMLSNYFLSKNIPILCINTRDLTKQLEYGFESDALHHVPEDKKDITRPNETSNIVNYRQCVKWLKERDQLSLDYDTLPDFLKT